MKEPKEIKAVVIRVFDGECLLEQELVESFEIANYLVRSASHRDGPSIWGQVFHLYDNSEWVISWNGEMECAKRDV